MNFLIGSNFDAPLIPIKRALELADNNQIIPVTIEGEIYSVEERKITARKTKKQSYIIKGEMYDGETEVQFNTFVSVDDFPNGLGLKSKKWIRIEGQLEQSQYTNYEWSLNFKRLALIEKPNTTKTDNAPIKRVELNGFTQMSRMRSSMSVDTLVKTAKELGHTHIALTDVNSVQNYPNAVKAAKEHDMNIIYGATLSLASEDNKIVYGLETDETIEDATYVSFDVETTGLSAAHDDIIEIGAIKIKNGEVLGRYQQFVIPTKPVPEFIIELTGITPEMIEKDGTDLMTALDGFLEFSKDAILVAHNATFDRDFILAACKKVNRTLENPTIIDTLEIGRTLDPNSKSNRLNVVTKRYIKKHEEKSKKVRAEIRKLKAILKSKIELEKLKNRYEKKYVLAKKPKKFSDEEWEEELRSRQNTTEAIELKNDIYELESRQHEFDEAENEISILEKVLLDSDQRTKNLTLSNHHRADEDAEVAGHILYEMLGELKELNITKINELNKLIEGEEYKRSFTKEITILALNNTGKKNLYKLISEASINYIHKVPRVTKTLLNKYREGLLIGSGSHEGPLFELASNKPYEIAYEDAKFYDFIEIQPDDIASHMVKENRIDSQRQIQDTWKTIYKIGKSLDKKIIATGHVHYVDKDGELLHNALLYHETASVSFNMRKGSTQKYRTGRHLRTTEEMLQAFNWLSEEETHEIVIENTNWVANQCEEVQPIPKDLYPPKIPTANDELKQITLDRVREIYGENPPEIIQKRLDKEFKSIIGNGFSVIYLISQKLVKNSNDNGYVVGSRGSVGSSFVATMMGITEVNPEKPHYVGEKSKWSVFFDHPELPSGYDLPTYLGELLDENLYSKGCIQHVLQEMGKSTNLSEDEVINLMKNHERNKDPFNKEGKLIRDGQDIPFETFLGFNGDKVPDIDLNFSGEYQSISHKYVEEMFGEKYVFRAGTIGTVAAKKAYGFIRAYAEENFLDWSSARINRLSMLMQGAKSTTGQHPGGILVVPDYMESEDFTPIQHPADDPSKGIRTSHFDFHSIHDNILKLDILGHDDPTMLRMLLDLTGVKLSDVAPNDEMVLKLFTKPEEALGVPMSEIPANTGTLGVPEFGTKFVQQMIEDTKPTKFAELVKISGLSHGTDVWLGNAKDLIDNGTADISTVIDTRDNIMVYLMQKGLEPLTAFKIMEDVRKGKGLKPEYIDIMIENDVPEWYIESCKKIKYMFPKAHAAAYVLSAMRIANFKVYHMIEFYTTILSTRYNEENYAELDRDIPSLRMRLKELQAESSQFTSAGEPNKAKKIDDLIKAMEIVTEAKVRGVKFGKVDLIKSHFFKYTIHDGVIYPPFISVAGLGKEAAISLYKEMRLKPFVSIDDINERTKLSNTNINTLKDMGTLKHLEEHQFKLF